MALVFLKEWEALPRRMGGVRGFLTLALLALLGALVPWRLGPALLDPVVLLAYASFAVLFAGSFTAQSFAGGRERAEIENRGEAGPADAELVAGKVAAGALFGWVCWALILGVALAALNAAAPRPMAPSPLRILALMAFAAGCAWFTACAGAVISLQVFTAQSARQLLRMAFFFLLLTAITAPRFFPEPWRDALDRQLSGAAFTRNLFYAALLLGALGYPALRRAVAVLREKRERLSILG
jgi:hypothetical protein